MASPDFIDPYLIPGSTVLCNLVGAVTATDLAEAEADLSFARAVELLDNPVRPTNDLREFKAIHRHLFQDVFDWAGQVRSVDVRKDVPGAQFFLPVGYIERAAEICFGELAEEQHLKRLGRDDFIQRLAFHYEKINYIHAFREGNGRTQRIFWNRIALEAGWQLDWRPVHGEENHAAARAGSDDDDLEPLVAMFDKVVTRADAHERDRAMTEIKRLSIAPSERT
ncbi:Fic/DOC family protein [Herbiconiux flava]|uniref:protein adenylyltransferase n=1 Tax=Herbiconiux flava TaxID=881268 RepID=A0A852SQL2_9MICO|nr:Fic family protein [Herbiconiux flava]NYD71010.1 cell filamentation protein [Herbiconiux flava]